MNAVVINCQNQIIATVDTEAREVEVAGGVTHDGHPVNVRTYRVSRGKANIASAARMWDCPILLKDEYNGRVFYTLSEDEKYDQYGRIIDEDDE